MTHPDQTRAEADAMLARVDALFDAVMAPANQLLAAYEASKLIRPPVARTRAGEPGAAA